MAGRAESCGSSRFCFSRLWYEKGGGAPPFCVIQLMPSVSYLNAFDELLQYEITLLRMERFQYYSVLVNLFSIYINILLLVQAILIILFIKMK